MQLHERIVELALTRSFFFPSNEPYGSVSGFYDYGPTGVLIKHKIEKLWRQMFLKNEGFHEIETSLVTPEAVLIASGHVSSFADPVTECRKCKTAIRADTLVEEKHYKFHGERWDGKLESLDKIIEEKKLTCPSCEGELGKTFMFNLMFQTGIGGSRAAAYCRPETAQGIFTAFPRIARNHGAKLPIGVGQVGRSFRNEISPRKGLSRMREFTQMELEYFFNPADDKYKGFAHVADYKMKIKIKDKLSEMTAKEMVEQKVASNEPMAYFLVLAWEFYRKLGLNDEKMALRLLESEETPHYSERNIDMEIDTSYGTLETFGNAYRTDFDLGAHAKQSGKDFSVFIEAEKKRLVPHVVELSLGVDRLFLCMLEHCYREKSEGKDWEWFDFPPDIAPYHVTVFPLMRKDGHPEKAKEIMRMLREAGLDVQYSESGSIGKRYARADEIGVPYAITVDYDTLKEDTVTIRYRNDGKQERVKISELADIIKENVRKGRLTL
jgi:glycyl-tRNA synthetase